MVRAGSLRLKLDRTRGHIKRALACALLSRAAAQTSVFYYDSDEAFFVETSTSSIVRLADSVVALSHSRNDVVEILAALITRLKT